MTTPVLGLDELADNQASPHATVNEAFQQLEGRLVRVLSRTTTAQPGSPVAGDSYIMPAGATGTDWSTYAQHDIAQYIGGAWQKATPKEGWNVWVNDADERVDFDGASWAAAAVGTASSVAMARIAGSTYSSVQHMQDLFHSAGVTSGGDIADDTDGTITVATGTGTIRATNSPTAQILFMDWAAESGANVNLTDNDLNYIYVEYNAGSPQAIATTTKRTDLHTNVFLGTVYRIGTELHITAAKKINVADHASLMIQRMQAVAPYAHESGAILTEVGTRNLAVTAGIFWEGFESITVAAKDTSVADTFATWYRDGVGGWTEVLAQTQVNNTQYDDGSGTLAALTGSKYGVHWVYRGADGDFYLVYGQGDYTLTEAQDASVPAALPPNFEGHAFIIGKIIIQKSSATFTSIESAFDVTFQGSTPTDHGNLTGLADDDHTQYVLADGSRVMTGNLTADRANEISAVTEKVTPVPADLIIIEDSAASFVKKKIQVGNLPGGGGEVNTASNGGTGGIGIVLAKAGVDLPFKSFIGASSRIVVTDDAVNKRVEIDVDESALVLSNMGGTLPITKGGTGATTATGARTALGVDPAGTDNSTDVTLAGTPSYLTIVGQVITRALINLASHVTGILPVLNGGTGSSTAAGARTNLQLVIGTDVQAHSTILDNTTASFLVADETLLDSISTFGKTLIDDADAATARATIGLGNVDNTSDADKPVSTAQQTALDLKANLSASYNNQTGTTYTLQATDNGKIVTFNNAASIAVTLPDTLDTNFQCTIVQIGAGVPTVTPGTDTINGAGTGVAPAAQWKAMYLSQYSATNWLAVL